MNIVERLVKLTRFMFLFVVTAIAMGPFVNYLITGNMVPTLAIYLPEMTVETFNDFVLVVCVQSVMTMISAYLIYAFDTLIIIIFVNMLMLATITVAEIRALQGIVQRPHYSLNESKFRLIKIIRMHRKYSEWVAGPKIIPRIPRRTFDP